MIYGIHHNKDLDGICSGAILKFKYSSIILIGYDYGQPMPNIEPNTTTFMVDVSMSMERMYEMAKICNGKFIWVDHHESANNDYKHFNKKIPMKVVFDNSIAGCENLWKLLFPTEKIPLVVTLIGMYDTWRNTDKNYWENVILPFQYGIRKIGNIKRFPMELFRDNNNDIIKEWIEQGKVVLGKISVANVEIMKRSFEMDILGYHAICVQLNKGNEFQSNLFSSIYDESKHDIMISFAYRKTFNDWKFHFRTTKPNVDCSKIAKWIDPVNGGGHRLAAGGFTKNIQKFVDLIPQKYRNKVNIL